MFQGKVLTGARVRPRCAYHSLVTRVRLDNLESACCATEDPTRRRIYLAGLRRLHIFAKCQIQLALDVQQSHGGSVAQCKLARAWHPSDHPVWSSACIISPLASPTYKSIGSTNGQVLLVKSCCWSRPMDPPPTPCVNPARPCHTNLSRSRTHHRESKQNLRLRGRTTRALRDAMCPKLQARATAAHESRACGLLGKAGSNP